MTENTPSDLTQDLFQVMKRFQHLKSKQPPVDNLKRSEYELLGMLAMNLEGDKKALSVTELSNLLQITPAGVTHLINPLEKTGYIKRLPAPNDRRIVRIGLTEKGGIVAEALIAEVQEQLSGLLNYLGEDDSKTLIRLMSQVIAYFE